MEDVIAFLHELYQKGLGYSAINTARCALSTFICLGNITIGSHPLIRRFLKGVYNLRPSMSRYQQTWDVDIVLKYLKSLSPVNCLNLKQLTFKTIMLMLLVSAKRGQSLHSLDIRNLNIKKHCIVFQITALHKETRPGTNLKPIEFRSYAPDKRLCVVHYLKNYLNRVKPIRGNHTQLFLSYQKPYKPISRATFSRYVKTTLAMAGIDSNFKPHSTRAAATSKAFQSDVPLPEILAKAGWSNATTFAKYYKKPLQPSSDAFQSAVLQH